MSSSSSFNATLAVLLAAKYCRQYPLFRWREEALPSMGRRAEKYCFRVDMLNLQQEGCGEMLLALLPTQLSLLDFQKENTLYNLKALLVTLKHPYILPVLDIYYSKEKKALLVVQPFVSSGSIKDRIYQVDNPSKPYDVKYRLENAHPLPFEEVAKFSRQILEALAGLRSKGLMCDHLRPTNVLIDEGNARLAEIFTPLLAIDRYKDSRELTVSLEQHMDLDLLLFGHVLYEMATGMELLSPQPEEGVLEMLAPEIAEVLQALFYYPESLEPPDTASSSSRAEVENNGAAFDDAESVSSTVSSRNKKHLFLVDVEKMLEDFPLFAAARDVPPIRALFSGFRLDSGMKSTIKYSMRINASRSQAHIVHYNDQEALLRARQRAERRVYEEKEKQQQRIQQLTPSRNPTSKGNSYSSKTIPSRRKTYRADSFRKHTQRTLSRPDSSQVITSVDAAVPVRALAANNGKRSLHYDEEEETDKYDEEEEERGVMTVEQIRKWTAKADEWVELGKTPAYIKDKCGGGDVSQASTRGDYKPSSVARLE